MGLQGADIFQIDIDNNTFSRYISLSYGDTPVQMRAESGRTSYTLPVPIQPPVDKNLKSAASTQKSIAQTVETAMIANVLISYFVNSALSHIYSIANALQLIVHLLMIEQKVPEVTLTVISPIVKLVNFDVIPEEVMQQFTGKYINLKVTRKFSPTLGMIGADSGFFMLNLFTPLVFISISVIWYAVMYVLTLCLKSARHCKALRRYAVK